MKDYEDELESRKTALFSGLGGCLLELGIGTGPNLRYYDPQRVSLCIGIDPNTFMARDPAET